MIKVKFLKDIEGSINGITNKQFQKDCEYSVNGVEISEYLYKSWLEKGILKEVGQEPIEEKAIEKAPENKAFQKPIENKSKYKNK